MIHDLRADTYYKSSTDCPQGVIRPIPSSRRDTRSGIAEHAGYGPISLSFSKNPGHNETRRVPEAEESRRADDTRRSNRPDPPGETTLATQPGGRSRAREYTTLATRPGSTAAECATTLATASASGQEFTTLAPSTSRAARSGSTRRSPLDRTQQLREATTLAATRPREYTTLATRPRPIRSAAVRHPTDRRHAESAKPIETGRTQNH